MNCIKVFSLIYSCRREILIAVGVLIALVLLPMFAVLGFMNNGVQGVSDVFVDVDSNTHEIVVRDPRGNDIKRLKASTNWPIRGIVTQEYGAPNPPYQVSHSGIDIDGGYGSSITVFMKGQVTQVGDVMAGCGVYCVIVNHGSDITSIYAHMSGANVKVGQIVSPEYVIGYEGEEGWANGAHLHFEIRVFNIPINPRTFLMNNPA